MSTCLNFSYISSFGDNNLIQPYIEIIGVSGGTAPYYYSLTGIEHQTGTTFTNLSHGYHVIHVSDSNGDCTAYKNVFIPQYPTITTDVIKCNIITNTDISVQLNIDTGNIHETFIDSGGNVWDITRGL